MSKYRVLALDGGGIRGLLTAALLEELCRQPGLARAFDGVNLIAGNSSGALIAIAMAHGLGRPTMLETLALLRGVFERGHETFGPRWPLLLGGWWWWSRYGNASREAGAKALVGEKTTLGQLKRSVLIPAFDLDNYDDPGAAKRKPRTWKPKLFHNLEGEGSDRDALAWKVALYSSAAPTFFPSFEGYVDGGVYANNPSMSALAQIYDHRYQPRPKPPLDDVLLFSVGAGQNLKFMEGPTHRLGILRWARHYVPLTMDGTVGVADYECRQMLGPSNYKRLAPQFPPGVDIQIDDLDSIGYMKEFLRSPAVRSDIEESAAWMRAYWLPPDDGGRKETVMLREATSKHLGGTTELTCLIPIKQGFIEMLDTRTFATRLRVVFKALHELRVAAREVRLVRPIIDIVDVARIVHSFSWAVVAERHLLLTVTFDRPWEPYIRVIQRDLGALIDLFMCNCDGFVPSSDGFEAFAAFVRKHQVDAGFFYTTSQLTVDDQRHLIELERLQRKGSTTFETDAATLVVQSPATTAKRAAEKARKEAIEQWLKVLNVLYNLRNMFPENSPDHIFLRRAAIALLDRSRPEETLALRLPEIDWFDARPTCPERPPSPRVKEVVQGGILSPYKRITHGCLLLARVERPDDARKFIGKKVPEIAREARESNVYVNVAFTYRGLALLGVSQFDLGRFPKEFREGMEARAGLLGDVQQNHPDSWTLPEWNVRIVEERGTAVVEFVGSLAASSITQTDHADAPANARPPVRLSTVDVVVTMQAKAGSDEVTDEWAAHPLHDRVSEFCREAHAHGIEVLSVQPTQRRGNRREGRRSEPSREHFGFIDGISDIKPVEQPKSPNEVEFGELLVGHRNSRGDCGFPTAAEATNPEAWVQGSVIDNGSFLVIRKLRQDVREFRRVVDAQAMSMGLDPDSVVTRMMGRTKDGVPLLKGGAPGGNDFTFAADPQGAVCPFHSHVRRVNPRTKDPNVPRIARRGMAYGPRYKEDQPDGRDRGLMFMAYNASIAEQFEILQRWLSGGNTPSEDDGRSTYGGQPDPFVGLPDDHGDRTYRFFDDQGQLRRMELGGKPFVTLQWGLYLFAPSIPALEAIARGPAADTVTPRRFVEYGAHVMENLVTAGHWAAVLEDVLAIQSGTTAAVYAAIRARKDGVVRTPYGVIVASRDLAMHVLRNDSVFSVSEYQRRFGRSVGEGYLGMDSGPEYKRLSKAPNEAVQRIPEQEAFYEAYRTTQLVLAATKRPSAGFGADRGIPLPLEPVVDMVLAKLAATWFDIPDNQLILEGGQPAPGAATLHCPYHFLAPSRYVFSSPNPRPTVTELGEDHGERLLQKTREFVRLRRGAPETLKGVVSLELFSNIKDDDFLARALLGLVFGFVPTVFGNAKQILARWLSDETFWRVQQRLFAIGGETNYKNAERALRAPIERAMQESAVPPLLHRTVVASYTLGSVALQPGDRVVVAVAAAARETLDLGRSNVTTVFGGDRDAPDHATHACPGYHLAMGVLLGMMAAILEAGTLAPTPALITVNVLPERQPAIESA